MSKIGNKRLGGIEPIVAAVLLIIVAVVGAVLLYLWFSGYMTRTASQVETVANPEKIKVEAIQYNSTTGTVTIYVRNVGEIPVVLDSAYVLDVSQQAVCSSTGLNTQVNPGDVKSVSVTCTLTTGEQYFAKVVTKRGTEAGSAFRA